MRRAAEVVDETHIVHGASSCVVLERVELTLNDDLRYRVTAPSPDVLHIAHSERRLIRRRVALCQVSATTDPRHVVVTITGDLESEALDLVRAAINSSQGDPSNASTNASFKPQGPDGGTSFAPPTDWFVQDLAVQQDLARSDETVARQVPGVVSSKERPVPAVSLHVAGQVFMVDDAVLVGRAPQRRDHDHPKMTLVSVDDPMMSKSHVAIGVSDDGVWAEDRGSSNGTELAMPEHVRELEANIRVPIAPPCRLTAGATHIDVTEVVT